MKVLTYLLVVFGLLFSACESDDFPPPGGEDPPCGPLIDVEITAQVLEHHLTGFALRDVAKIMVDYTESSILITPDGTFKGRDQIQIYYEKLLPAFPADETLFEIDVQKVEKEVAYIIWNAETPTFTVPLGTDTFVVEDGKIMRQTFVAQIMPK
ncbi:hypothetical protein C900_03814 [Fulvivirga imtechensis AK7]|uniref:SnoaL-like domain-containing protein n=1 Tax=Fulvivirga imtechensis AK7 TaxID=1237149 RepID=L8JRL4_9BACT|nr:nuclear transport factor 2 family protein [Fulvivirga imtechensis]ELR70129.1 hypothetical protein C900_03814 [Fulvivirga imtechensis AK7]